MSKQKYLMLFSPNSHLVLDDGISRKQAARFQDLLQQPSHAYLTGRANAGYARVTSNRESPLVSMATTLSGPLSDTDGCLLSQRFALAAVSGRPLQKSRNKFAFLVAARFAALIVSLPPYQFDRLMHRCGGAKRETSVIRSDSACWHKVIENFVDLMVFARRRRLVRDMEAAVIIWPEDRLW